MEQHHNPVYWLKCPICKGVWVIDDVPDIGFEVSVTPIGKMSAKFSCPNCCVVVEAEGE